MPAKDPASLTKVRESSEKEFIKEMFIRCGYDTSRVARELKISRSSVYALLKKYSISLSGKRRQLP
jgi:transcriptional regulator with PAS, ATPase and Fis domain